MFFAVALAAVLVVSCDRKGSKGSDDNKAPIVDDPAIDSLAYNLGLAQSDGLKQYAQMQLGVDSAYFNDFIKGMKEGSVDGGKAQIAYNRGLQVGEQIQQMAAGVTSQVYGDDTLQRIGTEQIVAGLIAGLNMASGAEKEKAIKDANEFVEKNMNKYMEDRMSKQYADWKKQNEDFLAKKQKDASYKKLPSGVLYKVIEPGTGAPGSAINADSIIACDYKGTLITDSVFDSSEGRDPIQVNMKSPSVIPGWVDVLKIMPKGAKYEVIIPQEQGYGFREMGPIKPFSTLIFTIEAKEAKSAPKAPAQGQAPIQIPVQQ